MNTADLHVRALNIIREGKWRRISPDVRDNLEIRMLIERTGFQDGPVFFLHGYRLTESGERFLAANQPTGSDES